MHSEARDRLSGNRHTGKGSPRHFMFIYLPGTCDIARAGQTNICVEFLSTQVPATRVCLFCCEIAVAAMRCKMEALDALSCSKVFRMKATLQTTLALSPCVTVALAATPVLAGARRPIPARFFPPFDKRHEHTHLFYCAYRRKSMQSAAALS